MAFARDHRAILQAVDRHTPRLRFDMQKELRRVNRAFKRAIVGARDKGSAWRNFEPEIADHKARVEEIIKRSNRRVIREVLDYHKRKAGLDGTRVVVGLQSGVMRRVNAHVPVTATQISNTTSNVARRALQEWSEAFDTDQREEKQKALDYFNERTSGGIGRRRSNTIAKTETHRAANETAVEMQNFLAEQGLKTFKTWRSRKDSRVRPSHRRANGQTVEAGEFFIVGGHRLEYPGDPSGPPEETINCRCAAVISRRRPQKKRSA